MVSNNGGGRQNSFIDFPDSDWELSLLTTLIINFHSLGSQFRSLSMIKSYKNWPEKRLVKSISLVLRLSQKVRVGDVCNDCRNRTKTTALFGLHF